MYKTRILRALHSHKVEKYQYEKKRKRKEYF